MDKSLKLLSNRKRDIKNILDDIKSDDETIVKDIYELSDELFAFLKTVDNEWLDKYCDMIKSLVEYKMEFDNYEEIKIFLTKSKNTNKEFIKYFFDGLNLKLFGNKKDDIVEKDEMSEEDIDNDDINAKEEIEYNKNIISSEKFQWYHGQLEALANVEKDDFSCGLISMITGSGKSRVYLKTIDKHFTNKNPKNGSVYIVLCPRIDILQSLFFEKQKNDKFVLDKAKKKFWKDNDIINLDNFDVIDCVNFGSKKCIFNKKKCNLLLINNDSFRTLYDNEELKNYVNKNTNLIIIDECQCLSGDKIYEILEKMKYNKKVPMIGFSATAIRNSKKSEQNVISILSKTFDRSKKDKRINLIYSYDLLQGIKDDIVLPYRIECVRINKIKGHKIGMSNKDILKDILKKCINVKTQKLPYKKFVVWTNRKDIMKECYKFIEKNVPELKVYCTSSFDDELSKEGFNTDYEEYYKSKGNSILICINKCKEGSDIPNVDCGIYFDGVKNRSILVHIQTSGRLIRVDKDKKKTHGDLIDTFILDEKENPHTLTAQKILSYLTRLLNLSDDDYDDQIDYYKQMSKLADNMEYNSVEQTLKIKIDEHDKHNTLIELKKMKILQMDWSAIKKELSNQVDKKFGISDDEKFNIIINKLRKIKDFNKDCDFWEVYDDVREKYKLPEDFKETYKHKFEEKTWYEHLNIDTHEWYQSYTIIKQKVGGQLNHKTYKIARKKYNKLPPHPEYLIKNFWNREKYIDY